MSEKRRPLPALKGVGAGHLGGNEAVRAAGEVAGRQSRGAILSSRQGSLPYGGNRLPGSGRVSA